MKTIFKSCKNCNSEWKRENDIFSCSFCEGEWKYQKWNNKWIVLKFPEKNFRPKQENKPISENELNSLGFVIFRGGD
jgi:hypothetical protein